jgi:hypothetical protein
MPMKSSKIGAGLSEVDGDPHPIESTMQSLSLQQTSIPRNPTKNPYFEETKTLRRARYTILTMKTKRHALYKSLSLRFTSWRNHSSPVNRHKILDLPLNTFIIAASSRTTIRVVLAIGNTQRVVQ